MITKERLEELIEQDKVFYWVFNKEIRMLCNLSVPTYWKKNWELYGKDCFETKEDAEEYAEFGNITRTEKLELPMWKDIEKEFDKLKNDSYVLAETNEFSLELEISKFAMSQIMLYTLTDNYNWNLTRENYNEARRLCKELFLEEGEGDDIKS